MHGSARGSGAPKGNRNAYKTGAHTAEVKAFVRNIREIIAEGKALLREIEDG